MAKRPFSKPPLTCEQQLALMIQRGLRVRDEKSALSALSHFSYYRLSAYWRHLSKTSDHIFIANSCFDAVVDIYQYDRALRLLVFDAIACIEISVRSQWARIMSNNHGAHAHLNTNIHRQEWWTDNKKSLHKEINRAGKESFIRHFNDNYEEETPPIWAVSEVMSFSLLSRWFKSIRHTQTKQSIADIYGIPHTVLAS